jgi:hypothetical protein
MNKKYKLVKISRIEFQQNLWKGGFMATWKIPDMTVCQLGFTAAQYS